MSISLSIIRILQGWLRWVQININQKKNRSLIKKEIHEMSLWLKMSFHKEKQRQEVQMLIYIETLRESNWFVGVLAKVSQLGWWGIPTSSSPSLLVEFRMIYMVNHGGSWMNTILKDIWVSRRVLTIRLFLWMFWEKSFKMS